MKYKCIKCNFETNHKGAWYNHKKSNKHLKLDETESYKEKNNESIKNEINKNHIDQQIYYLEIKTLQKQIEEQKDMYEKRLLEQKKMFEEQKILYDNQINLLSKQLEYFKIQLDKELSRNKGNIINNTLNIVNYIKENHLDTPVIEAYEDYLQILGADSKDKMREHLILYNSKNNLPFYFGDYLSKKYRKENVKEQSIFCTDISRNNFLLRLKENNEIKWVNDKGGNTLKKKIIFPLIKYADILLNDQIQNLIKNNDVERVNKLFDVLSKIKDKDIMNQILKQIGPDFQINESIINNAITFIKK